MSSPIVLQFCKNKTSTIKHENINAWIKSDLEKGNWSFVYIDGKKKSIHMYGNTKDVKDKDRMELVSVLELLTWLFDIDKKKIVTIYTTNVYVINCLQEWMERWQKNNFIINCENEVKNRPNSDILQKIKDLRQNLVLNVKFLQLENEYSNKLSSLLSTL